METYQTRKWKNRMSEKELERFDQEETNFEKFIKRKKYIDKERKKSLRDYRGKENKRSFKTKEKNDKTK